MTIARWIGVLMFVAPVTVIAAARLAEMPNDMKRSVMATIGVAAYWAVAIFLVLL